MPTDIRMPQMGESITEGTIVRWIKHVGDKVDRDEPLFEISTDKVDAEIPSPAAGVLTEIRAKEGETVAVDSVVAVIGVAGEAPRPSGPEPERETPVPVSHGQGRRSQGRIGQAESPRVKSSPLIRRIAREQDVDISEIRGTGVGGRVTKDDILEHIEARSGAAAGSVVPGEAVAAGVGAGGLGSVEQTEVVPMTTMRRKIAERMVSSRRTAAHVHSVFEVDFSTVAAIRDAGGPTAARPDGKLTYLAFIAKVAADALRAVPVVNASVDRDQIVYRKEINLGIAVALEEGLIVPVIKRADQLDVLGLSRTIADLAARARAKQLRPEDVEGGTFTITNPGVFGSLFGMPIINPPQVAILCVGAIEKRPVVANEVITIRPRAYLTLGFDHRLIDGGVADDFLSRIKKGLENFDPASA